jgi:thiol-disulfide isomerase/thioredoxin
VYYKKSLRIYFLLIIPVILIFSACENEDNGNNINKNNKTDTIRIVNDQDLSEIISERNGRTLFINVWATWCVPCVEEFPDIVRTYEHFKNSDVDFISLNVDFGSDADSLVVSFMRKFKAEFPVYNVSEKSSEQVINLLNPEWSGAIPATFIYDKSGEQKVFILGSDDFTTFRNAVDSVRSL